MVLANDYRHPVVLAKEAATLDVLTGGRFDLGIGAGWMTTDYEAAGIPLDRPGLRIERLAEALGVLRGCGATSRARFAGEHYRVTELDGHPKPLTPGGPPIVIGGGGRRVLSLAGREADVVGINVNLAAGVIDRAGLLERHARDHRREGGVGARRRRRPATRELHVRVHLAMVTDDREAIVEQLAGGFGLTPDQARADPARARRRRRARSAISWSSAASAGASATSACPPTSSSPSPPSSPASRAGKPAHSWRATGWGTSLRTAVFEEGVL